MKKTLLGILIVSVAGVSLFFVQDKKANAVNTPVHQEHKVQTLQNKTIAAAVAQFKDKDMDYVKSYFTYDTADPNRKFLAIKENDGYGFMQGSSERVYSNGKTVSDNADTDPNAATVDDILAAIEKANQEK